MNQLTVGYTCTYRPLAVVISIIAKLASCCVCCQQGGKVVKSQFCWQKIARVLWRASVVDVLFLDSKLCIARCNSRARLPVALRRAPSFVVLQDSRSTIVQQLAGTCEPLLLMLSSSNTVRYRVKRRSNSCFESGPVWRRKELETISPARMSRSAEGKRARSLDKHTVHCCVAVVGLPSHELSTGDDGEEVNGIGKSCLCSRFVLPSHDDYAAAEENHSSAVSESEFRDREINSDHYLYFGTVLKLVDTRSVVFHVVEHTTFTDPATRGVHEAGESYAQRATAPSLRSSNKVSYIGGRFRGVARQAREKFPNRFDRRRGPSGGVNGYVLVLDVTVSTEQVKSQINLLSCMADRLAERGNKPYVIALSKCDMCEREKIEATVSMLKEEENFANASIFETSARSGVGVEEAFSHLHRSICRLSSRRSMVGDNDCDVPSESSSHSFNEPFQDSANAVSAARLQAYEGVVTLMSSTVQDATLTWPGYLERIGQSEAFAALISLCGISFCCRLFKSRLVEVKAASITSNEDAESEYSNAEPLSAESQLNAFFSKHSDFAQDMPLDIQSYL